MSAHLDSRPRRVKPAARRSDRISLKEAAHRLGYHVETLRLRVRRGEFAAERGPHGAYFVSLATLAKIKPPIRSARRTFAPADLERSWLALGRVVDREGARYDQLEAIGLIRRLPDLAKGLHHLLDVQRFRLAGLTSAEIRDLTGLSKRHVRRLSRINVKERLDGVRGSGVYEPAFADEQIVVDVAEVLDLRRKRRARRVAKRIVADIERRLEAAGFQYHHRPRRPFDMFVAPVPPRAFTTTELDQAVIRKLLDGGLTRLQITAISLVGIGDDELNELILKGLPPAAAMQS